MADLIRTYINAGDDEIAARERVGFIGVERYCTLVPEKNELGAIVGFTGETYIERGMLIQHIDCKERIFIRDSND